MKKIFAAAALLGLASLALFLRSSRRDDALNYRMNYPGAPISFAHRGGAKNAPENTLIAFSRGLADGANALEMDVHLTSDGEPVVIHDPTVDRTTNGTGAVAQMTLEELRGLDAGFGFAGEDGYPYRGRGVRIPTLREVLKEFPGVRINFEVKCEVDGVESGGRDAGEEIHRVLQECGAMRNVTVAAASHRKMRRIRHRMSGVETSGSLLEIAVFTLAAKLGLEAVVPTPYVALQVPVEYRGIPVVTPGFVRAAHARGIRVDVWTVDDADEMRRLIKMGVDGIMTDRPDVLREVISGRDTM